MLRFASEGRAAISFEASSGGSSAFTALRLRTSLTIVFVSTPVEETAVFSTTPVEVAANTVIPPPVGSAFICRVGLSSDTSC